MRNANNLIYDLNLGHHVHFLQCLQKNKGYKGDWYTCGFHIIEDLIYGVLAKLGDYFTIKQYEIPIMPKLHVRESLWYSG